jgi:hypothetical protein
MRGRRVTFLGPFYGYDAKVIAAWCGVSVRTAQSYKNGSKRPSPSVLKLFRLHKENRVLTDFSAWNGWSVSEEGIFDPDGNCTSPAQLQSYWLIMQYAAEVARLNLEGPSIDALRELMRRRA